MKKRNQPEIFGNYKCRDCGSTECDHINDLPATDFASTLANGQRYTSVVRDWVQCGGCDLKQVRFRYCYDPAAWKE